jgi:hypothetical protein
VTLGQADLSLIPLFFLDQSQITTPSLYHLDPNAGIGGTMNLSTQFKKSEFTKAWGQVEYTSLRNAWYGVGCQIVQRDRLSRPVHLQLRAFVSNNANEFEYRNPYTPNQEWESQSNNNSSSRGLQLQYRKQCEKGNWMGQFWTIDRLTQLPSTIGSHPGYLQKQWDNQNRATYYFEKLSNQQGVSWKAGGVFLSDRQTYWMYYPIQLQLNDTNRIQSYQTILFSEWNGKRDTRQWWLRTDLRDVRVHINGQQHDMQLPQLMATWKQSLGNAWRIYGAGKWSKGPGQIWNKSALGGLSFLHSRNFFKEFKIQGQWVERAPDFNELYWPQSGNPQLRSEQSIGSSAYGTLEFQPETSNRFRLEGSVENRYVKNWIQWTPQTNGIWSPRNIQEVWSWHAEWKAAAFYRWRGVQTQLMSYTEWNDVQGIQLDQSSDRFNMPYVPRWKVTHQLDIIFSSWSVGCSQRWISARYTDQNNARTMQLPAVQLWNLFLANNIKIKEQQINIQFKCENIMNTQYQEVRSYAIPGRVWSVQVNYPLK